MSARVGRWVLTHRAPVVLVRGYRAGDLLQMHGFKPLWSNLGKGWVLDDNHLADIAAIASLRTSGYRLEEADGTDCFCAVAPRERRQVGTDPSCICSDLGPLPAELVELLGAEEFEHAHRGDA